MDVIGYQLQFMKAYKLSYLVRSSISFYGFQYAMHSHFFCFSVKKDVAFYYLHLTFFCQTFNLSFEKHCSRSLNMMLWCLEACLKPIKRKLYKKLPVKSVNVNVNMNVQHSCDCCLQYHSRATTFYILKSKISQENYFKL